MRFDLDQGVHIFPVRQLLQMDWCRYHGAATRLKPSMTFVQCLAHIGFQIAKAFRLGNGKILPYRFVQRGLVILDRQKIISALRNDCPGNRPLTAHRVNGHDRTF